MGLFDVKKENAGIPAHSPAKANIRENDFDSHLAKLKEQEKEICEQIGMIFAQEKSLEEVRETPYEEKLIQLKKISQNQELTEKRKLASQGLRKCESCGNVIVLDSIFCNKCGEKLPELFPEETGKLICAKCGMEYEEGNAFCAGCGAKLTE